VQVTAPAAAPVVIQVHQRGLLVRVLWYLFIGWWLSGLMMFTAAVCVSPAQLLSCFVSSGRVGKPGMTCVELA
jgi:hypothetical protein